MCERAAVLEIPSDTLGRGEAFDRLFEECCTWLREKASAICRGERAPVIATGDLLSELYLKLRKHPTYSLEIASRSRLEFLWMATRAMRNVLTDLARRRGAVEWVSLSAAEGSGGAVTLSAEQLLDLGLTLEALEKSYPRQAAMITMRYYGGLSVRELEECWDVSDATVERELKRALKFMNTVLAHVSGAAK